MKNILREKFVKDVETITNNIEAILTDTFDIDDDIKVFYDEEKQLFVAPLMERPYANIGVSLVDKLFTNHLEKCFNQFINDNELNQRSMGLRAISAHHNLNIEDKIPELLTDWAKGCLRVNLWDQPKVIGKGLASKFKISALEDDSLYFNYLNIIIKDHILSDLVDIYFDISTDLKEDISEDISRYSDNGFHYSELTKRVVGIKIADMFTETSKTAC